MCIFAQQLDTVLERHGLHLGSLYAVRVGDGRIHPRQILRLKRAAGGDCSRSVTLNPDEIAAMEQAFSLDDEDQRRLRAALIAESVYRFLLDRIDPGSALAIAERLFTELFSMNSAQLTAWGEDAIDQIRVAPEDEFEDESAPMSERDLDIEHELEPAVQLYDEALLWIAHARATQDQGRQAAYASLAVTLLMQANDLMFHPTENLANTQQLADSTELVTQALQLASEIASQQKG